MPLRKVAPGLSRRCEIGKLKLDEYTVSGASHGLKMATFLYENQFLADPVFLRTATLIGMRAG
jgi:hypothetical protein